MQNLFILTILTLAVTINQVYANEDHELDEINNARKCFSAEDCGPGYCCTVGHSRFSEPICKKLGTLNSRCHKRSEGEDKILSWPNGISQEYINIYIDVCPCERYLSCSENRCGSSMRKRKLGRSSLSSNNI